MNITQQIAKLAEWCGYPRITFDELENTSFVKRSHYYIVGDTVCLARGAFKKAWNPFEDGNDAFELMRHIPKHCRVSFDYTGDGDPCVTINTPDEYYQVGCTHKYALCLAVLAMIEREGK